MVFAFRRAHAYLILVATVISFQVGSVAGGIFIGRWFLFNAYGAALYDDFRVGLFHLCFQ